MALAAIDAYASALGPERTEFAIDAFDELGLPCAVTTAWGDKRHPFAGGIGYGIDAEAALLSARGEAVEYALLVRRLRETPVRRASYAELRRSLGERAVVDPLALCLEAGTSYDDDRVLDWVFLRRVATGEPVAVPIEFVAPSRGGLPIDGLPPLVVPITNGSGAGDTPERAISHALGELLQRDGNNTRQRALDEGIVLDLGRDDMDVRDPATRDALARMRAQGLRVLAKLATTQFGVVDVHVVADDTSQLAVDLPMLLTCGGEAAHPDREVALRKAVYELASSRARKAFSHGPLDRVRALTPRGYLTRWLSAMGPQEPRALEETVALLADDVDEVRAMLEPTMLSHRTTVRFADLPTTVGLSDPSALCAHLTGVLTAAGFDVLAFESRSDDGEAVVARVVVPGLEVETCSYGRLGERGVRDLLDRGDGTTGLHGLVGLGPAPATAAPVVLSAAAYDRLGGRPWFDRAALDRVVGRLYPVYREPTRHAAPLHRERALYRPIPA